MIKKIFIAAVLLTNLTCALYAQAEADAIQRRQQQDAQDMLRRREREMAEKALSSAPEAGPPQTAAPGPVFTAVDEQGCLDINGINLSGITKISLKKAKERVKTIIGPCITKEMLQQIQTDIQKMYVDKGYVAARVYFDFSSLREKRLNIIVAEGRLEEIILLAPKTNAPQKSLGAKLKKLTAFPFTTGYPLNLRDIEQGLEQMNRLQSNNAAMEIRPGGGEGDSVIIISNDILPQNQISLTYDNSGSGNTGVYRGAAAYSRDNLLSLNENIFLNAATTLWNNRDLRYSDSYTASIVIPFGYWTLSDSLNYSNYLTTTQGSAASFESSGDSMSNALSLEHMLLRGGRYKMAAGAQLMYKSSNNYIEDVYIETSSRKLSIGTLYLTGTYYSGLGSFYSKLSLNRGLALLGAKKDEIGGEGIPKAQYTSAGFYFNFSRNFGPVNYGAGFDSQYGFDDMFASEQMMIGGESTVRGFKEQNAFGESGFVIRQDIKTPLAAIIGMTKNNFINTALQNTYLGAFFDYGYAAPKTYGESAALAGAGAKLSCYTKYLSGGFTYARAVKRPARLPDEGNIFYFNLALNVAF